MPTSADAIYLRFCAHSTQIILAQFFGIFSKQASRNSASILNAFVKRQIPTLLKVGALPPEILNYLDFVEGYRLRLPAHHQHQHQLCLELRHEALMRIRFQMTRIGEYKPFQTSFYSEIY